MIINSVILLLIPALHLIGSLSGCLCFSFIDWYCYSIVWCYVVCLFTDLREKVPDSAIFIWSFAKTTGFVSLFLLFVSLYIVCVPFQNYFFYVYISIWETGQSWPTLLLICTDCVTSLFSLILFHCVHTSFLVVKAWGQWCFLYISYWMLVVSHHFIKCFLLLPSPNHHHHHHPNVC